MPWQWQWQWQMHWHWHWRWRRQSQATSISIYSPYIIQIVSTVKSTTTHIFYKFDSRINKFCFYPQTGGSNPLREGLCPLWLVINMTTIDNPFQREVNVIYF